MEVCEQHQLLMQKLLEHQEFVGRTEVKIDNLCKATVRVDNKITELVGIAESNRSAIAELKSIIKNGYKEGVAQGRLDRVADDRVAESVPGFAGSLNRAFNKIRDNFAFYIILGSAALLAWYVMQRILLYFNLRSIF